MKLKHVHKRTVKNSLFRVVNELDGKMYPLGLKDEVKYIDDINAALGSKYSKVEIANMLRRIMSYVIITGHPISTSIPQAKKVVQAISNKEIAIIVAYIVANNQYIAECNNSDTKTVHKKNNK